MMEPRLTFPDVPQSLRRPRRRRRVTWFRLLLILVLALFAVYVLPTPWAFHMGGRFSPLAQWDGYGLVKASNGGRYLLFTHLQGGIVGDTGRPSCSFGSCETLRGSANLCAQNGRMYSFDVTGGVSSWWSTDGARTSVDLVNHEGTSAPLPDGWVVAFHGAWHGSVLALFSPDNSFTEVFTRTGTVRTTTSTADAGTADVTLRHGSGDAFASACHALAAAR